MNLKINTQSSSSQMIYIDKLAGIEAMYKRTSAFYSAPVTKFWLSLLLYSIFLVIHSYTLLLNMRYVSDWDLGQLAPTEIVVWAWYVGTGGFVALSFSSYQLALVI